MTKWVVLPSISLLFAGLFLSQFPQSSYQYQMGDLGRMVKGHLGVLYDLRSKISSKVQSEQAEQQEEDKIKHGDEHAIQKESRDYSFHYSPSSVHLTQPNSFTLDSSTINSSESKNRKKPHHTEKNRVNKVVKKKSKSSGLSVSVQPIMKGLAQSLNAVIAQKLMKTMDQEISSGILNPLKHLVSSGNRMVEFWDKRSNSKVPGVVEMLGIGLDELKRYKEGQPLKSGDPVSNLTSVSRTLAEGMVTVKKLTNRVLGYDPDEDGGLEERGYGHDSYGHGHGHMSYGHYLDPYAILATLGFGVFLFNVIFNLLNNQNMASGRSLDVADLDVPLALSDIITSSNPIFTDENALYYAICMLVIVGSYMHTNRGGHSGLDPFSLLAALAFGAFLLQLLLTLLNTSSTRSLDVVDINVPLMTSDFHIPNMTNPFDRIFGTPTTRLRRNVRETKNDYFVSENGIFGGVINKLSDFYKNYQRFSNRPECLKRFGFSQLMREELGSEFVKNLRTRLAKGDDVECEKFGDTECIDE